DHISHWSDRIPSSPGAPAFSLRSNCLMPKPFSLALPLILCTLGCAAARADDTVKAAGDDPKATPQHEAFFVKKVRPILAARCLECHGEKKQEGGLRLDSRSAILKGNDAGPAVVPGKPDESRLVEVIGHQDVIKMPPKQKLGDDEIATLTEWVKIGAPYPARATATGPILGEAATPQGIVKARATHWAYQPIRKAEP